jgi:purine-binding chemotaxis protein CheW
LVYLNRELKLHLLSADLENLSSADAVVNIVVLQADGRQFGMVVDEINDTEEIVVKPLGKQLKSLTCFAGYDQYEAVLHIFCQRPVLWGGGPEGPGSHRLPRDDARAFGAAMIQGLINLRGQIATAIDLRRRLELAAREGDELPMNVVVRSDDGAVSLLVDEIGDVVEIQDDIYERPPETLKGVARELVQGVYKLKKHLLLILDTEKTVNLTGVGNRLPETA